MTKSKIPVPKQINTISQLHSMLQLSGPKNPLVSVINQDDINCHSEEFFQAFAYNFYVVALKKNFEGKMRYGQQHYDFDGGVMTFTAPGQVLTVDENSPKCMEGFILVVHPDFFQSYPLASKIKEYGFFSYEVHEALHLSEEEEQSMMSMANNIEKEITRSIDPFTQDLIVSHIDLLLNYSNRFYNRQFITRKIVSSGVLVEFEKLLDQYFSGDKLESEGVPSVLKVAEQLNLSSNYLSDLLRVQTGQTTKQHIQSKLIDKAKQLLTTTTLSVSEIAYQLGFEYPQSFNKLFKAKTDLSPLEFRQSFN